MRILVRFDMSLEAVWKGTSFVLNECCCLPAGSVHSGFVGNKGKSLSEIRWKR